MLPESKKTNGSAPESTESTKKQNCHPDSTKKQCCSELFQRKSALKQRSFCCSEKIDFSVLIRVDSALFRNFQLAYSAESELKQHW